MQIPNIHPSHLLFFLILALGGLFHQQISDSLLDVTSWFATHLGWLVMLSCSFFVGFAIYLAMSPYGRLTLGDEGEKPAFSTLSWLAMLFAAGMGAGLVFYGAAEPLIHYLNPPPAAFDVSGDAAMARRAMAITYFHWGIHAWAIYAIAALSIAYFTFHVHKPMLPSAGVTHGMHLNFGRFTRQLIDTMAILGVVFGMVASISQALLQLSDGVMRNWTVGLDRTTVSLIILGFMFVCYMLSACTGIGKGIKILSNINILVAGGLLLFVLCFGPTLFILDTFVTAIGDYIDRFISLSFNVRPHADAKDWTGTWTVTYFLWWISWAPFVGVFIARISRGRTIRQFLIGVIIVPSVFSAFWFAVFGGSALNLEIFAMPGFADGVPPEGVMFKMLEYFPLQEISAVVVLGLLFVFLVTSADSGSYVLAMFTVDGDMRPPVRERLFWGVIVGVVTGGAVLLGEGTEFFRAIAVVGSVPYLFVMLWQCRALYSQLKEDHSLTRQVK